LKWRRQLKSVCTRQQQFITKRERRPITLKEEKKGKHLRAEGHYGERAGEEEGNEEGGGGDKGGGVSERNWRRERICWARAVPSKKSRRNRLRQRKTRNSEDPMERCLLNISPP
jgi:hypothetical protein